jgi:hypothetical protein
MKDVVIEARKNGVGAVGVLERCARTDLERCHQRPS